MQLAPISAYHLAPYIGNQSYGIGAVVKNLAREQRALGLQAEIWTMAERECGSCHSNAFDVGDAAVHYFRRSWPNPLWRSRPMLKAAREIQKGQIDICHVHGIWTGVSGAAEIVRRGAGASTIVAVHGSLEAWALKKSRFKKAVAWRLFQRSALRNAACLHATSAREVLDIRECGLNNPIALIRNGVSREWCQSQGDPDRFRQKNRIPEGKRILLFMSRITPKKGLVHLLRALAMIGTKGQDWVLTIVGENEFGHLSEVLSEIARLGLEKQILILPGQYGQDKRDCFEAAEAMVLPSLSEGDPMVVLDSMGVGVPAITTTASPWQELEKEGCGYWVPPTSAALASALEHLFQQSPGELILMGSQARKLVMTKYLWEISAKKTKCLYEWVLGRRPNPGEVEVFL